MILPSISSAKPIGIIGVGLVGFELARRLIDGGKAVVGYDIKPERLIEFARIKGQVAAGVADVITACDLLLISLPSHQEVTALLELQAANLHSGLTIIDTTTGDPASSEAIASSLKQRGIDYLDATISGSSRQVRDGSAVMMVGGDPTKFAACQDLFALLADATFHTGANGTGAKMKLITNLVLGLNRAVFAEGLAFAEGLGFDLALTLKIMRRSPAYSYVMDAKGEKMIEGDFTPEARLSQHLKDVHLIVEAGLAAGLPMPLSLAHRDILEAAEAAGLGRLDNSSIIRMMSSRTTVPPAPQP
jgi:3-hydroxyisobutyrate dehydrogenase-like beta-hydroxyacid dehydrogenase